MNAFNQTSTIRYSFIIFAFLFFVISLLLILFILDYLSGPKWSAIIPGLLTGFIVALFQAFLSWYEIRKIDEYNNLKIKKILSHRKDANYYGNLISKSKNQISVLGVTAQRFLEDFGNTNTKAPEHEKVLLRALDRGVKVKILVAKNNFLEDDQNKQKASLAEKKLNEILKKYQNNFEYRYYEHKPTHSIVIIDEECIVGPIFPKVESKYTPAIHLNTNSTFAEPYTEYFSQEWDQCGTNKQETN
jgi:hypothetical protein